MLRIKLRSTRRNQLKVCTKTQGEQNQDKPQGRSAGLRQAKCIVGNKALDITESEQTCKNVIPHQTLDFIFQTRKY